MSFARTDRSIVAQWWFTVDRVILGALLALIAIGVVVSLAASPAAAVRRGLQPFHLVERHAAFALASAVIMLVVSMLMPSQARRLAALTLIAALAGMAVVLVAGPEINGAHRWLRFAGVSLQPSEFAKPGFAVLSGWLLAEGRRRSDVPAMPLAVGLLGLVVGLLLAEPDVGQALLACLVWGALFLLSGQALSTAMLLGTGALAGSGLLAWIFPHVQSRLARFLGQGGDTFQTDRAIQSFTEGGFFGRGPGEGTIKTVLPDANTDFIFAVIAEEFGILACLALLALFAFVTVRALVHALDEPELGLRLPIAGLALFLAFQALINMSVNVGLLPAKGMTLPFVSNGGSSMLALGLAMGLMLALTRRRADPARTHAPSLDVAEPLAANTGHAAP